MDTQREINQEQEKLWNTTAGRAWVDAQEILDRMLAPFERLLVDAVAGGSFRSVLDVGCGTGSTTVAIARTLGEPGRCVGIDLSAPMIEAARVRARTEGVPASFIRADAQNHPFEPSSFDKIVSRFGVMFFDDLVAAFANLRRAAKDEAPLHFVAWRSPEENPFMTTAERPARAFLPDLPPRRPDAPGQFALADAGRLRGILEKSGWTKIDLQAIDVNCTFPKSGLEQYFTRLGPLGQILEETDEPTRKRIIDEVRAASGIASR